MHDLLFAFRALFKTPGFTAVAPIMSVPKFETFRDAQTSFGYIDASAFNSAVLTRDGAERGQVINLILAQGMRLVVLGLAGSAAGSRLLSSLPCEVQPLDPLVFGGVTVLFAVVAIFACLPPSLRAARIDPLIALRTE